MKYYAVKVGKKPGIYESWTECKENVDGFAGAIYKSFSDIDEAKMFISGDKKTYNSNLVEVYVDGSFDINTHNYSFGCVLLKDGEETHFKKAFDKDEYSEYRNVAGEVRGASFIINYLYKLGIKEFNLYYDYMGIEKWYTLEWKANNNLTQSYQEYAKKMNGLIKVNFIKVKSHTNNKYNDLADKLAKEALGL